MVHLQTVEMSPSKISYLRIHTYTLSQYLPRARAYTHTQSWDFLSYKSSIPSTRSTSASPSLFSILLSSYLRPPSAPKHLFRQATHTPHTQWVVVCVLKFVGYPFKIGPDHPVSTAPDLEKYLAD